MNRSAVLVHPLLLVCLHVTVVGCAGPRPYQAVDVERFDRLLSVEELRADAAELFEALESVHPDVFHAVPRAEFERRFEAAVREFDQPMTAVEAWPRLARLTASVQDAHTRVVFPFEVERRDLESGASVLPMATEVGDEVTVARVIGAAADVPIGATLVAIDGRPLSALRAEWRAETGMPTALFRHELGDGFARHVWRSGLRAPFEVRWRDPVDGGERVTVVQGVPYRANEFGSERPVDRWRFEDLGGGIGLIEFSRMQDEDEFRSFLDETFARLSDEGFRGLVIDMRRNGGGRSTLGQMLIDRFADRPYRMLARKEWRSSARMKEFFRAEVVPAPIRWLPDAWLSEASAFLTVGDGRVLVSEAGWIEPRPETKRFAGPVCVLIGKRTFSSALMTVNAIEDGGLATLVGEETGDAPNHFGELCMFRLTHSRLLVRISSARFVRANGDADDRSGVVPHLAVTGSGVPDPVLAAAVEWLNR